MQSQSGSDAIVLAATDSHHGVVAISQHRGDNRTSNLEAPTMLLTGHDAAIYSLSFSPSGNNLASASLDGNILLWDVFGKCSNYNCLEGHKNAVLELKWEEENTIVSCSADKSVVVWDANKGARLRKFNEHTAIVNSCSVAKNAQNIIASASDDCSIKIWDNRSKFSVFTLEHDYPLLSTCLVSDGNSVYSGGVDNIIRCVISCSKFCFAFESTKIYYLFPIFNPT